LLKFFSLALERHKGRLPCEQTQDVRYSHCLAPLYPEYVVVEFPQLPRYFYFIGYFSVRGSDTLNSLLFMEFLDLSLCITCFCLVIRKNYKSAKLKIRQWPLILLYFLVHFVFVKIENYSPIPLRKSDYWLLSSFGGEGK
jgi:hypothetical protein